MLSSHKVFVKPVSQCCMVLTSLEHAKASPIWSLRLPYPSPLSSITPFLHPCPGLNNSYSERPPVFLVGSSYLRLHHLSSPQIPLAFHNTNHNLHFFTSLTLKKIACFPHWNVSFKTEYTTTTSHPCIAQGWALGIHSSDEFLYINEYMLQSGKIM